MKLTKKEYTSREEKRKDSWIGVGVFIGLNVLLYVLQTLLVMASTYLPLSSGNREIITPGLFCLSLLPILVNVGVIIYFALTRSWIALGMLGTFGFLMLLVLLLGLVATVVCFFALGSGL